jgi:hypothetical protein
MTQLQSSGNRLHLPWVRLHLGWLAFFQEDWFLAQEHFSEAEAEFEATETWAGLAACRFGRGWIAHTGSDSEAARGYYAGSLSILREREELLLAPYVLGNWVILACSVGQMPSAALVAGATVALESRIPSGVPPALVAYFVRSLGPIRRALGDGPYATAFARGTSMSFEQTVDLCLGDR